VQVIRECLHAPSGADWECAIVSTLVGACEAISRTARAVPAAHAMAMTAPLQMRSKGHSLLLTQQGRSHVLQPLLRLRVHQLVTTLRASAAISPFWPHDQDQCRHMKAVYMLILGQFHTLPCSPAGWEGCRVDIAGRHYTQAIASGRSRRGSGRSGLTRDQATPLRYPCLYKWHWAEQHQGVAHCASHAMQI